MPATVLTAKVIGTVTIGLWAGYNSSLVAGPFPLAPHAHSESGSILKPILVYIEKVKACVSRRHRRSVGNTVVSEENDKVSKSASAPSMPFTPSAAVGVLARHACLSALSGVAFAASLAAYTLAPSTGKHPYLLYVALGAPIVGALQRYGASELGGQVKALAKLGHDDSGSSDEDVVEVSDLGASSYENVKPVKSAASLKSSAPEDLSVEQKYGLFSRVVAALSAFLFVVDVIGLAGAPGAA